MADLDALIQLFYIITSFNIPKGEPGDAGSDGTSCSVITNANGSGSVICTYGSSYTIQNGNNG